MEFFNTGQTDEIFGGVGKHFFLRQRLNSFLSMRASSSGSFLSTMIEMSSGQLLEKKS